MTQVCVGDGLSAMQENSHAKGSGCWLVEKAGTGQVLYRQQVGGGGRGEPLIRYNSS